jgi:uncharacterized protein YbjT (DUF2867 family)
MVAVVFGAQGNVGRHVVAGLLAAGEQVRATSRDPGSARLPPGVEAVTADLEQAHTLPAALAGAEKVFLYARPRGIDDVVAAARTAGVRQVALLSSAAVTRPDAKDHPIARDHRTVELALEGSGLAWTFVRGGMFATNALWWWARSIRKHSAVRTPYPDAYTAPVHEQDLADIAVTALTRPGHDRAAYTVVGPQSLTVRQQVQDIATAIGRPIALQVCPVDEARAELGQTMPAAAVDAVLRLWAAGIGTPAPTSTVVPDVTGHPARTFAEWARDHADDFRKV